MPDIGNVCSTPCDNEDRAMTIRTRKFIGAFALLIFVIVYMLAAMVLAQILFIDAASWVQLILYAILGLAWVFPAMGIICWMEKPTTP